MAPQKIPASFSPFESDKKRLNILLQLIVVKINRVFFDILVSYYSHKLITLYEQ